MSGTSLAEVVSAAARRLEAAGVVEARRDARLLVGRALGGGPEIVTGWPERLLSAEERLGIEQMIARRAEREPVSRILGIREFWGLPFKVTSQVLDPRPDSETVVEALLGAIGDRSPEPALLDLGTGSGCLLIALLAALPKAHGFGVDISLGAVELARENALRLGFAPRARFLHGDWAAAIGGRWQGIVSNPPYIKEDRLNLLEPEVGRYEPRLALYGGSDGLAAYRRLAPQIAALLSSDGIAAIEIGEGQADAVAALFECAGLEIVAIRRDLGGRDRCLLARLPSPGTSSLSKGKK